ASALLIVAAAQPVLRRAEARSIRTDAELFVVLDTSRSMAASASPSSPTREERAKRFAIAFRSALPGIRSGLASFTDRLLRHLLPSDDIATFDGTVDQAMGIERPPPSGPLSLASSYATLARLLPAGALLPLGLVLGRRGGGSRVSGFRKRLQRPFPELRSAWCAKRGPRSTTWPAWRASRPPPSRAH